MAHGFILKMLNAAVAMTAAAFASVAAYSALSPEKALGLIKTNAALDAFTVPIWPALGAGWAVFWLWEAAGRKPSIAAYSLAAPLAALILLRAYFYFALSFGPAFQLDRRDAPLIAALAAGGAAFAAVRKLFRPSA